MGSVWMHARGPGFDTRPVQILCYSSCDLGLKSFELELQISPVVAPDTISTLSWACIQNGGIVLNHRYEKVAVDMAFQCPLCQWLV